jgi:beta-lactamase class A
MIAADPPPPPIRAAAESPRIVRPVPYQVSFGQVVVTVPDGTRYILLRIDGKTRVLRTAAGRRMTFDVSLPGRDSTLVAVAVGESGWRRRSAPVGPVYGLPRSATPRLTGSREDPVLARRVRALARGFPATAGVYVQDLTSGAGASWNARARFPAASTLKLAIAVEALRAGEAPPVPGSTLDSLIRAMLIESSNRAANQLEVFFGGSTSGGSAKVNAMMRTLGLTDSEMYGGYLTDERAARPIPIGVVDQPSIANTKYSTAWDLGRLMRYVYLAAGGKGPLVNRLPGLSAAEARYLVYVLLHVPDRAKLGRFLPRGTQIAHKAGWLATVRHDNGLVFWDGGALVATVMTWSPAGVGTSADVLAGRIAQSALRRFG